MACCDRAVLSAPAWAAPVLSFVNPPAPYAGTEVMNVSAWDPQTGISKVSFCYETPGTPATATSPAGWTCPNSTDVPRALQGTFSGPYNYRTAFDTTWCRMARHNFKAIVCNGVGMCVDTNILRTGRGGQHGAGHRQHVAAQLPDHRDQ